MTFTEQMVLAQVRRLTRRDLQSWMQAGWVRPALSESGPMFDEIDVARLRLLCDLRKEMAVPPDAMPIVLSLLDQLHQARRDLRLLAEALTEQPEDVRRAIVLRLRERAGRQASGLNT